MTLVDKILDLKARKNAVFLGHYYIRPELQNIMDHIGDSLALSKVAKNIQADLIVFCGVHFMAETAKILNPEKKVLIPDLSAGCSLAESCNHKDLAIFKNEHPDYKIISYINCSAEVKALSDIICTSGNAKKIVASFPTNTPILFAPDKNLGAYLNKELGLNMQLWPGSCHVHDQLKAETLIKLKQQYPEAKVVAHPECNAALLVLADFIGSTAQMLDFVKGDKHSSYIVATETGILESMQKEVGHKTFHILPSNEHCSCNDCEYMKQNTLERLYQCMLDESPSLEMNIQLMDRARKPLLKMLELS